MNLHLVTRIAQRLDPCAVIGAYALAARGYVRQTADFDLMTTDQKALSSTTWSDLAAEGVRVDIRKGDFDDPLGGVVRIRDGETSIDVVVAKYKWERAVLERAEPLNLSGVTLPVPTAADLILLKLSAGGYGDLQDIVRLVQSGNREHLVREVDASIEDLPDEMRTRWKNLRAELA